MVDAVETPVAAPPADTQGAPTVPPKTPAVPAVPSETILKPEDQKPSETKPPEAPIEYGEFKLPDGAKIDEQSMGDFKRLLGEHKVPQEKAQAFLDLHNNLLKKQADEQLRVYGETQKKWLEEVKADPELGGNNLPKTSELVLGVLDRFGGEGFAEQITEWGLGANPRMIRFLHSVAKATGESPTVAGGSPGTSGASTARAFYPNSPGLV